MRTPRLGLAVLALGVVAIAACTTEKQWMKVAEPYTTAEFRRDYAECSQTKNGTLDEDCLRARGWVDMKPSKGDRAADTPPPPPPDYRHKR